MPIPLELGACLRGVPAPVTKRLPDSGVATIWGSLKLLYRRSLPQTWNPQLRPQVPFSHPEYGTLTGDWIIYMLAGHDRNHLAQLETIAKL